ncbi:hypothetical protein B9G98_00646 [Wickerhamiella sorbophila]|uniref:RNA polymerase II elongation factor ELL N-terminal domain-containing protein n=1 Tax=Wickerhamiella sorbophila TaxID=45607 RepID=A0A2T0FDE8_9ASCO|nr:hypothetical protein B9G98_00646 [Wickerhamiella sorbophila]PRT53026.1 hypothetical protein B9G98_00646 [Wickerhamiella sorbophila]
MPVPSEATLVASPPQSTSDAHPPMFVRLTPEALSSLKSKNDGRILLKIDGRTGTLAVNGTTIDISVADEPGTLQVYTPCADDSAKFQSAGLVKKRLTLRKSVSSAAISPPAAASAPQPTAAAAALKKRLVKSSGKQSPLNKAPSPPRSPRELLAEAPLVSSAMRVAHLLALGQATAITLAQRTQIPVADVQTLLNQIARPVPGSNDLFILRNESYEYLRIYEWKQYSAKERLQVLNQAEKAYDALGYVVNAPSRSNLKDPRRRTGSVSPERRALKRKSAPAIAVPPSASTTPSASAAAPASKSPPSSASPPSSLSPPESSQVATKPPPEKKHKPTTEEDLFTLARKFKATYSEYSRLYGLLSSGPRPESQVKKLLTMHKNLESWKQRLWSASKNRRGRQVPLK